MNWNDIRRQARAVVHETFADAMARIYAAPGDGPGALIAVRVHNKVLVQGDLAREGYAQVVEEIERAIFLRADVVALTIRRGSVLKMVDGRTYKLEVERPTRDDFSVEFEVVRVS